ncbi:MAG: 30S ribosomal protein S7 [Nanoarchaeota archaeon]|nr:30S ribosomal protein S7 [Nanoarchaeota archaeon]MEC8339591.1 30S ribosomal protein S7 [Nanoarchaeota archaeon]
MAKETKMDIKLFNRWSFDGVVVSDQGLQGYLNIEPIVVPRTNGYHHNTPFYKTKINIVERLMNRFQVAGHKGKKHKISSGHNTGKAKSQANMMIEVLEALEKKTKENPIQVLVTAIENAAPREEVITIERSGARYAQAVDIGPQRRIDLVLRYICQGAAHKAFDAQVSFVDCIVAEIMAAYNMENAGMAMTRRSEIEKMAAAAK